jgi:HAE1 family hydrophobic/amphiphilic exporter-1
MNKQKSSWLSKISVLSAKHINAGFIIWTIIIALGLICYLQVMKREGFPNVQSPIGSAVINYPVNDKNIVDEKITKPVVEETLKNSNVKKVTGISNGNGSNIIIEYKESADAEAENNKINNSIKDKNLIPKEVEPKFSKISAGKYRSKYDVLLAIHSESLNNEELFNYSQKINDQLKDELKDSQVEVVDQLSSVKLPNGTEQSVVQGFDWYGYRDGNEIKLDQSFILGIQKPDDKDLISYNEEINSLVNRFNSSNSNIQASVAAAEAPVVESQIEMLQKNLLEGILIVSLVCLAFISVRAGIVASISMLATLTLSMIILYLSGITLNTITLFSLILCIGLIVDDTVIMIEAIEKYEGKFNNFIEVVRFSANRVAVASLAGTLTTMLGFAPLLFITGVLGKFIRILPITVMVSLAVSLLVSVTFVPFFARVTKPKNRKKKSNCNPFVCLEKNIGRFLHNTILKINTSKKKLLAMLASVSLGLIIIAFGVVKLSALKFDIFPQTKNTNNLKVVYSVEPSQGITNSREKSATINNAINESVGEYVDSISYYSSGTPLGGTIQIKLTPYEKRDLTSLKVLDKLKTKLEKIEGADIYASQVDVGPPKDEFPFKVQINNENSQAAISATNKLNEYLSGLSLKRPNSSTAKINKTEFKVESPIVTRVDNNKVIELKAGFDSNDTSTLVNLAKAEVEKYLDKSDNRFGLDKSDFKFDFGSESSNQESFKGVIYALPILLIAMYILLAIQFKGFIQPLLIFMAVPFSLPGVAIGLTLTNNPISFFAVVGFFALIGISVNNTIMLVDFANQKRREGFGPREAMAKAIKARIRPLLVTSITAVVALLPLVLTDPFWESLAVTLMFGLISSTILVTTIFPYYYLAIEKVRYKKYN